MTDKQDISAEITIDNDHCYVYLMIDLTNNYHKIGISNKPGYREKTLQSEKPTIEMLCYKRFPNRKIATSFELALHQSYADKRVRGEWFDLTEKEVQELNEVLTK
ncbi:MAG: GIY-YIG nuclease family protein [Bacteroidales bacterium]|nr:GIY-YIG nuclease family protein [Bacteroidales bacterium]